MDFSMNVTAVYFSMCIHMEVDTCTHEFWGSKAHQYRGSLYSQDKMVFDISFLMKPVLALFQP